MYPEMIINPFFLLLLLLLPLISFLISKKFISRRAPQIPPGPYQWPLVGNIFQLGKLPHHTIAHLAQTHGPLMSLKLGSKLLVVGSSPAAAREILKTHDRALSGRFVRPEFRTQADDHDDQWSRMRSVGRSELFSGKAIESQATLWSEKIDEMVEDLRAEAGSVVEIEEKAYVVTLNILGNLIFSGDLVGFDGKGLHGEGLHGEMRGLIRGFADLDLTPNLTDLFPVLGDWDLFGINNKFREVFKRMLATWDGIVSDRRKQGRRSSGGSSRRDLLDTLIGRGLTNDLINPFLLVNTLILHTFFFSNFKVSLVVFLTNKNA